MDLSLEDIITKASNKPGRGRRQPNNNFNGRRGGRIQKRSSGGFNTRKLSDKWQHDLFGSEASASGSSSKLSISNLDFGVNDDDIQELFQEFGTLKRAAVHYDRSGRSLGTGEVIYANRSSAVKAMEHYNGLPLDGRPMNIQLIGGAGGDIGARNRLGSNPQRSRNVTNNSRPRIQQGGGGRGRGRGGNRRKNERPTVSKEDLDKELAAYISQRS